ncbi:transposase [Bradyrhizobium sp. 24]|uniref:transposase n=1 Tax=unclassified Bradyrhizobium TaxID=2631580 RepID=UPI001FFB4FF8|nr:MULTISPECIES: transposase [unclassified Bradyrhizobium]MCK1296584.1 transposase [Bradyrhizobium sp. 37]MCK1377518.1 transposase [Bradyrhizobium sp. 24]MCK1671109.1 transposase [Bradyrhizobium sp. 150]MCK1768617.1 transposase [Bradyrhizobium sp. 134]
MDGLTPRAQSSGGKERLGAVSKPENRQLRTHLIVGATSIIKLGKRGSKAPLWIRTMLQRRAVKLIAVEFANSLRAPYGPCWSDAASIMRRVQC